MRNFVLLRLQKTAKSDFLLSSLSVSDGNLCTAINYGVNLVPVIFISFETVALFELSRKIEENGVENVFFQKCESSHESCECGKRYDSVYLPI